LGPQQVEHVAKAAEEPDVPLVLAHAMSVQFAIDQEGFLLVQGEPLHVWIASDSMVVLVDVRYVAAGIFSVCHFCQPNCRICYFSSMAMAITMGDEKQERKSNGGSERDSDKGFFPFTVGTDMAKDGCILLSGKASQYRYTK